MKFFVIIEAEGIEDSSSTRVSNRVIKDNSSSTMHSTAIRVSATKEVIEDNSSSPIVSSSTTYSTITRVSTIKEVLVIKVLSTRVCISIYDTGSDILNGYTTQVSNTKASITKVSTLASMSSVFNSIDLLSNNILLILLTT